MTDEHGLLLVELERRRGELAAQRMREGELKAAEHVRPREWQMARGERLDRVQARERDGGVIVDDDGRDVTDMILGDVPPELDAVAFGLTPRAAQFRDPGGTPYTQVEWVDEEAERAARGAKERREVLEADLRAWIAQNVRGLALAREQVAREVAGRLAARIDAVTAAADELEGERMWWTRTCREGGLEHLLAEIEENPLREFPRVKGVKLPMPASLLR